MFNKGECLRKANRPLKQSRVISLSPSTKQSHKRLIVTSPSHIRSHKWAGNAPKQDSVIHNYPKIPLKTFNNHLNQLNQDVSNYRREYFANLFKTNKEAVEKMLKAKTLLDDEEVKIIEELKKE